MNNNSNSLTENGAHLARISQTLMLVAILAAVVQLGLLLVGQRELWLDDTWAATFILHESQWWFALLSGLAGVPAALAAVRWAGAKTSQLLALALLFTGMTLAVLHLDAAFVRWTATMGVRRAGWRFELWPTGYPQAAFVGLSVLALSSRVHAEVIAILERGAREATIWPQFTGLLILTMLVHVPFSYWTVEQALASDLTNWGLFGVGHLAALAVFDVLTRLTRWWDRDRRGPITP